MRRLKNKASAAIFGLTLATGMGLAAPALANTDPLPNDSVAPPPNVNLFMFYNQFNNSSTFTTTTGDTQHSTRVAYDATTVRYVRSFETDGGFQWGVQGYISLLAFPGQQKLSGVDTTYHTGFGQPNFSFFFWPYKNTVTGSYWVISPWVSPPVSSYNNKYTLNPTAGSPGDAWYYEFETGYRRIILGRPSVPNLAFEGWSTTTFYTPNKHYLLSVGPLTDLHATYRQQTEEELRAYAVYTFAPDAHGSYHNGNVTFGVYQSFGGKQTLNIPRLADFGVNQIQDSGQRTQETQLRVIGEYFVTPSVFLTGFLYYGVHERGGTNTQELGFRVIKFY